MKNTAIKTAVTLALVMQNAVIPVAFAEKVDNPTLTPNPEEGLASLTVIHSTNGGLRSSISTSEVHVKDLEDCKEQAKIPAAFDSDISTVIACPTQQGRTGFRCFTSTDKFICAELKPK